MSPLECTAFPIPVHYFTYFAKQSPEQEITGTCFTFAETEAQRGSVSPPWGPGGPAPDLDPASAPGLLRTPETMVSVLGTHSGPQPSELKWERKEETYLEEQIGTNVPKEGLPGGMKTRKWNLSTYHV